MVEPLFHFSDNPGIRRFDPRPLRHPGKRRAGEDWLNGPLVWAIDAAHAAHYLFPRDCPRIVLSRTARTTDDDADRFLGPHQRIAYIEESWLYRLQEATLYRYSLPPDTFRSLDDAGMYVSDRPVTPLNTITLADLPKALAQDDVTLRPRDRLTDLHHLWDTTLQVSGIRLRNAVDWPG